MSLQEDSPKLNDKFTSIKLRWMTAFMSITEKSGFTSFDKCVAYVIMNAINEKTRDWKLSDETIAALAGRPGAISSVKRTRKRLKEAGWIGWKRTADANVYFLCHQNVWAAMDAIMQGRTARRERRRTRVTRDTMQSVTHDPLTYSRDIHEKKESKSLPTGNSNNAEQLSNRLDGPKAPDRVLPLPVVVARNDIDTAKRALLAAGIPVHRLTDTEIIAGAALQSADKRQPHIMAKWRAFVRNAV